MTVVLDIETNGLLPDCDTIHCACAYDTQTKEFVQFDPKTIHNLPMYLDTVKVLSCHNGISFDLKVIKKVLNYDYKGQYVDTLLLSRILWPDREGGHSVAAWGEEFGVAKPSHEDWSVFSPEMAHRNKEDVKIQTQLYDHIQNTIKLFAVRDSRTENRWEKIIAMEQKTWSLMEDSADRGWQFDLQLGYKLVDELDQKVKEIEGKLIPVLPKRVIQLTKTESGATKCFKADGSYTKSTEDWFKDSTLENVLGDFCRVKFEPFNIGSSDQVKTYLLSYGWFPKEWNYKKDRFNKPIRDSYNNVIKASPKVPKTSEDWEETSEACGNKDIALLAERNKAAHRRSQIQGLISSVRLDHRIEAQASTCSTNTARMTHRIVVNIPKADPKIYYGHQMRSLFIASPGNVLVGADASALEARCEAHYVYPYDKAAALELLQGDIHSLNAEIFQTTRNIAKNGKYAILYGCSPQKLAATIGKPIKMATSIYESYWDGNPALKQLKEDLEKEYKKYGYLLSIDGRPLTIRYKHAIINTLFQSCGAIAMKVALCILMKQIKQKGLNAHLLGMFHDEMQLECKPDIAEQVGQIAVKSIQLAGEYLKLNVQLDGEYKTGISWSATH